MVSIKKIFTAIILSSAMLLNNVYADSVTKELIALDTDQGEQLFYRCKEKQDYWPLSLQFVTQANLTYCAIASSVMVLNALSVVAPVDQRYKPYRFFTQTNFFTPQVQQYLQPAVVQKQGVTLDEIAHALATFPIKVQRVHADAINMQQFRNIARAAVASRKEYIIVNFARAGLNQYGAGHMSPLAAYDEISDRFLLMDVSRYKYPPVWVATQQLWNAMHTIDETAKAYRGFVIVSKL